MDQRPELLVPYVHNLYLQAVKDLNAVMSGVNLLPTILPQLVFAIGSGVLGKTACLLLSS
jgi:hypothetical protein